MVPMRSLRTDRRRPRDLRIAAAGLARPPINSCSQLYSAMPGACWSARRRPGSRNGAKTFGGLRGKVRGRRVIRRVRSKPQRARTSIVLSASGLSFFDQRAVEPLDARRQPAISPRELRIDPRGLAQPHQRAAEHRDPRTTRRSFRSPRRLSRRDLRSPAISARFRVEGAEFVAAGQLRRSREDSSRGTAPASRAASMRSGR